ncbi:MAG: hypothetical protein M5R36_26050 [Deltaproteobacteria bacterium]|nr:hypothetical protein [Deltaproteobacteria bacterium]
MMSAHAAAAWLSVVEGKSVDRMDVVREALPETIGAVLTVAVRDGRPEMPEATFAGDARFAEREEGDVPLEAVGGQLVDVGADGIDDPVDALGEIDARKVFADKIPSGGIIGQERRDLLIGDRLAGVFDDGAGDVVAVPELVIGDDGLALLLEHEADDRRPGKEVRNRASVVRRVLPDEVD